MVLYFLTEMRRVISDHFKCPHTTVVADVYFDIQKWSKFLSYLPEKLTKCFKRPQMFVFMCSLDHYLKFGTRSNTWPYSKTYLLRISNTAQNYQFLYVLSDQHTCCAESVRAAQNL